MPLVTSYGDFSWLCPAGVTTVLVECWGSGGCGSIGEYQTVTGGGGGGGAYARTNTIAVIPGNSYFVRVGGPYCFATNHESIFINNSNCQADFGISGSADGPGGAGGQASSCTGDLKYSGGNGGWFGAVIGPGYGGGGGASREGPGASAGGVPGGAGADRNDGGYGGPINHSAINIASGSPGVAPGGGGGGGGVSTITTGVGSVTQGGSGAIGAVMIWNNPLRITDPAGLPANNLVGQFGNVVPVAQPSAYML